MPRSPNTKRLSAAKESLFQASRSMKARVSAILLRRYQRPNGARFKAWDNAGDFNAQSACRLFMLPPELRNIIYELVFMSPSTVDFLDACSPPKALVMTCRRIHEETSEAYTDIYRSYWSNTKFSIDVFEGLPPFGPDQVPEAGEAAESVEDAEFFSGLAVERKVDKDKQTMVYAEVQELHDQDLAHISNMLIYSNRAGEFWNLDESASDMWNFHYPLSEEPKYSLSTLYFPATKAQQLRDAGFDVVPTPGPPNAIAAVIVTGLEMEEVVEARRIIGRIGLWKEELMAPIRGVCRVWVHCL